MSTMATERTTLDPEIQRKGYVHPDVLVTTNWLAEHLHDPNVRIIESDEDVLLFDTGHIPGAQKVDWHLDLNDAVVRAARALLRQARAANERGFAKLARTYADKAQTDRRKLERMM